MTREELATALWDLERAFDQRVDLVRVVVDESGQPTGQCIYRGSFSVPPDWRPPPLEHLIAIAKGRRG